MAPVRPKTAVQEENERNIQFLQKGDPKAIDKAIVFFDESFLPLYDPNDATLRDLRHQWMNAIKFSLVRKTPTEKQKLELLRRFVKYAASQCILSVVQQYLFGCHEVPQFKLVEQMLRKENGALLNEQSIRDQFPYSLG